MTTTTTVDFKDNEARSVELIDQRGKYFVELQEFDDGERVAYYYEDYENFNDARKAFNLHLDWIETGISPQYPYHYNNNSECQ